MLPFPELRANHKESNWSVMDDIHANWIDIIHADRSVDFHYI